MIFCDIYTFITGISVISILIGIYGIFTGSMIAGSFFFFSGTALYLIFNPSIVINIIKNMILNKQERDVTKDIKNKADLLEQNTAEKLNRTLKCRVISKNKSIRNEEEAYEVSIRDTDGNFFMLNGYESFMKSYEGQELNVEFLLRLDKDGDTIKTEVVSVEYL